MAVPVTVHCAKPESRLLPSGTTADTANSIFSNTTSDVGGAGTIGVQMTRNGSIVPANSTVSLAGSRHFARSIWGSPRPMREPRVR